MAEADVLASLTHKGWFWFVPIYLSPDHPDCPVATRQEWMEPLFTFCTWLESARIFLTSIIVQDYEPTFMFMTTGER